MLQLAKGSTTTEYGSKLKYILPKRKFRHFDGIAFIEYTKSCHMDHIAFTEYTGVVMWTTSGALITKLSWKRYLRYSVAAISSNKV